MNRTLRIWFCWIASILLAVPVYSQLINVPYMCGFEDQAEIGNWVLNYGSDGPNCKEQWVVGNGARSEGRSGLYISTDGSTAAYGVNSNIVVAYREFSVPEHTLYDISFDWRSMGQLGTSDLYVLLLLENESVPESDSSSGIATNTIQTRRLARLNNSSQWQNHVLTQGGIVSGISLGTGVSYKLTFVWVNNNRDSVNINKAGACIDNIQIVPAGCLKPSNLQVNATCDTTVVTWSGSSAEYEVEYKSMSGLTWNKLGIQTEKRYELYGLSEGSYAFRVRGICKDHDEFGNVIDTDTSAYVTANAITVFCPEEHCINYVALDDPAVVTPYIGSAGSPFGSNTLVDNGPEDMFSRHTVNWIPDEYDPRTKGHLPTIPEGEVASVRLGNWDNGAEGEGLVYPYVVDPDMSLLLLKYAVVLQDPNHNEEQQPGFLLEITDEYGVPIDPTCGRAEFYADADAEGWHSTGSSGNQITWKDWTTVGLDLSPYVGQTLYIRLSTWDCTMSAHYGYAYFTLDCASAVIRTNSCGDNPTATIEAPEGFTYTWYNPNYPDSEWYTPSIDIPATDTTTYYCDVRYMEDTTCGFTLSTQAFPRFPVAEFEYEYRVENCQNLVRFVNKSHIMTQYEGNVEHTDDPCEAYTWDFGTGQTSAQINPEVAFPNEGGTFDVTLYAYIADMQCMEDTVVTITIPPIGTQYDTIRVEACEGTSYIFGDRLIMGAGTYFDTVPSVLTGCDSITMLQLTYHPQYDMPVVVDTICFGESYSFAGRTFTQTTQEEIWLTSQYGCDSIVSLDLYVFDEITFDAVPTDVLEGPNSGRIDLENVSVEDYTWSLNGEMNAPLTGLAGGVYTVVVYNEHGCASAPVEVTIVQDCLEVELSDAPLICGDDAAFSIPYSIGKGYPTTYDVVFDEQAKAAGFADQVGVMVDGIDLQVPLPAGVRPGQYTMTLLFEDLLCDTVVWPIDFTVQYPASILTQKWNDVIAIRNAANNGGYDFSAYQWYKDGQPIEGETDPYLYIAEGALDTIAEYTVLLTRSDDGESVLTCPIIPAWKAETDLYPTVVPPDVPVTMSLSEPASVQVYDMWGVRVKAQDYPAGAAQQLIVADVAGHYFVHVRLQSGDTRSFKVIVTNR